MEGILPWQRAWGPDKADEEGDEISPYILSGKNALATLNTFTVINVQTTISKRSVLQSQTVQASVNDSG